MEYSIDGIDEIDGDKQSPGNKIVWRFDENGNPIEEEFDKDGYLVKRKLFDKDGKLKQEEEFGPDGKVKSKRVLEYDKNGKPIKD